MRGGRRQAAGQEGNHWKALADKVTNTTKITLRARWRIGHRRAKTDPKQEDRLGGKSREK